MRLFDWILIVTSICGIYVCYWIIKGFYRDATEYPDVYLESKLDDQLYRAELKKKLERVEEEYKKRHPEPDQDFMNGLKPTV